MRRFPLWFVLAVLVIVSEVMAVAPPPAEPPEVAGLVADLASDDIAVRKAAMRNLEALGEAAVPALRRLARSDIDADVRLRAIVTIPPSFRATAPR